MLHKFQIADEINDCGSYTLREPIPSVEFTFRGADDRLEEIRILSGFWGRPKREIIQGIRDINAVVAYNYTSVLGRRKEKGFLEISIREK